MRGSANGKLARGDIKGRGIPDKLIGFLLKAGQELTHQTWGGGDEGLGQISRVEGILT